jgi:hypothetical protein
MLHMLVGAVVGSASQSDRVMSAGQPSVPQLHELRNNLGAGLACAESQERIGLSTYGGGAIEQGKSKYCKKELRLSHI